MNDHSDTDDNGDGEGVWSPDIEQCFREALLLFPPCGRRKHILQEEGGSKMYGRNELIARHIRMRTGKVRSRKQVSSHIQVLARRRAKAEACGGNGLGHEGTAGSSSPASSIGQSQVTSIALMGNNTGQQQQQQQAQNSSYYDQWADRPIVTTKIRLVEFSAFIEYRRQLQLLPEASSKSSPTVGMVQSTNLAMTQPQSIRDRCGQSSTPLSPDPVVIQQGLAVQTTYDGDPTATNMVATQQIKQHLTPNYHMRTSNQLSHTQLQVITTAPNSYQTTLQQTNSQLQQQPLNNNQHHQQQMNQRNSEANNFNFITTNGTSPVISSFQHQTAPTSSGFTRHSYVKINYRQPLCRQSVKLERIDISLLQDKFPEIGGSEGLFQRGPSDAFFLVKFWADMNNDFEYHLEDQNSYFGFSCHFETVEPFKDITCSTKACSYGLQVVEKVEKINGAFNSTNGRYSYDIDRSPMCEFMIQFIKKLRHLPMASQMNSVLENFSVLQVITSESTSEILLCLAFVFEIASDEQHNGSQYHVYKLTKD